MIADCLHGSNRREQKIERGPGNQLGWQDFQRVYDGGAPEQTLHRNRRQSARFKDKMPHPFRASHVMFFISRIAAGLAIKAQEQDKRLHAIWSFWLVVFCRILWSEPWAFFLVLSIGLAKELWDHRFGSGFCFYDLLANIIGVTLAICLIRLLPGTLFEP